MTNYIKSDDFRHILDTYHVRAPFSKCFFVIKVVDHEKSIIFSWCVAEDDRDVHLLNVHVSF